MASIVGIHSSGLPIGTFVHAGADGTAPAGSVICDASAVSRTGIYAILFSIIGCTYGIGDGSTTFNLPPDGLFLRGRDQGSGNDPDATTRTAYVGGTWTTTGNTASGSNIISGLSNAGYANVAVGMTVTGTGISGTAIVTARLGGNSFQINSTTTGPNTGVTFTFSKSATGTYAGSFQTDQIKSHTHNYHSPSTSNAAGGGNVDFLNQVAGNGLITTATGGNQTNGKNINTLLCITYK